jgi:hypothetical protein
MVISLDCYHNFLKQQLRLESAFPGQAGVGAIFPGKVIFIALKYNLLTESRRPFRFNGLTIDFHSAAGHVITWK